MPEAVETPPSTQIEAIPDRHKALRHRGRPDQQALHHADWPIQFTQGDFWTRRAAHIASGIAVLAAAILLVRDMRKLWFYADDWEFLLNRGLTHNTASHLFSPHNEHWSTLPILVFRALYSIFGVRSYWPYGGVAVVVHLIAVCVLWSLLNRLGTFPWVTTGVVALFAFLGAGAENVLWDFQIGFAGSVMFGLVAMRIAIVDRGERKTLVGVWVALVASMMCSGMALPMLFFCFFYFYLAASVRRAFLAISVPVLVYAIWYVAIGHVGTQNERPTGSQVLLIPQFVTTGLVNIWSAILGISSAGFVMLIVLAVVPFLARQSRPLVPIAAAGMLAVVCQYLLIATGRIRFGIAESEALRYIYVGAVLMFPALALLATIVLEKIRNLRLPAHLLIAVAFGLVVVNGVQLDQNFFDYRLSLTSQVKPLILGSVSIVDSGQVTLSPYPDPTHDPDITTAKLARPDVRRAFGRVHTTPQGLLDAAGAIQVGVSKNRFSGLGAASVSYHDVTQANNGQSSDGGVACSALTATGPNPYLELAPQGSGAMIELKLSTSSVSTTLLRAGLVSAPSTWGVVANETTYIATSASDTTLRVALPAGTTTQICPIE